MRTVKIIGFVGALAVFLVAADFRVEPHHGALGRMFM